MSKLALSVESDSLGTEQANAIVLLNGETDIGQKLSCLITEFQRLNGNLFAVYLTGHSVGGWQSSWINYCHEGRLLLRIKFVKPRARKFDPQMFLDYVNARGEVFVRQLELSLEARVEADRKNKLSLLAQAAEAARSEALNGFYRDIKRDAMAECGVADILRMLMDEVRKAARGTSMAERQAILNKHVAFQVDKLSKLGYLDGIPVEEIKAAVKVDVPSELPDWIGQINVMNL